MIFEKSRYTNTDLVIDEGVTSFARRKLLQFNLTDCNTHIVVEKDTLDQLAFKYYGDAKLWWVILEANQSTVKEYFDVKPGTKLKIPKYYDVLDVISYE